MADETNRHKADKARRRAQEVISLRMDEDVQDKLRMRAQAKGIPLSRAVRDAVEMWLNTEDKADSRSWVHMDPAVNLALSERPDELVHALRIELEQRLEERDRVAKRISHARQSSHLLEAQLAEADRDRAVAEERFRSLLAQREMTEDELKALNAESALIERRLAILGEQLHRAEADLDRYRRGLPTRGADDALRLQNRQQKGVGMQRPAGETDRKETE